ncbi:MAG: peptide chain release factor-like protein [bacterium]
MPVYPVSEAKQNELEAWMLRLHVSEADLEESFIRSSGPGGQNVNKTSTCVYLIHLPSGTEVKCQKTRSQAMNRFLARRLMCEKIERQILGKKSEEERKREKIRRQKRKRSKRAKEKMLEAKHHRGKIKKLRKMPYSE